MIEKIEFKKQYGLTFVFTSKIIFLKNKVVSCEIIPIGIIYKQYSDYYFAPLCNDYDISDIVEKYVKNELE